MLWGKLTQGVRRSDAAREHRVQLVDGLVDFPLPEGTTVTVHGETTGAIKLPRLRKEFHYSISSHDLETYGLQDDRPAETALGDGEFLMESLSGDPKDDYGRILEVGAVEGPYAPCRGYLMRLEFFRERYLRAFRIAFPHPKQEATARDMLTRASFAPEVLPLDEDTWDPTTTLVQIGAAFRFCAPPGWTVYPGEKFEDDEGTDQVLCISPDERAVAEVTVSHGFGDKGDFPPAFAQQMLDGHLALIDRAMAGSGDGSAIILERSSDRSLARFAPVRDEDGRPSQTFHLYAVARDHILQTVIGLTALVEEVTDTEWASLVDGFEPCIRKASVFHPHEFVVGA